MKPMFDFRLILKQPTNQNYQKQEGGFRHLITKPVVDTAYILSAFLKTSKLTQLKNSNSKEDSLASTPFIK